MTDPKRNLQDCIDELRTSLDEAMPTLTGVAPIGGDTASAEAAAKMRFAATSFAETARAGFDQIDQFIAQLPDAE